MVEPEGNIGQDKLGSQAIAEDDSEFLEIQACIDEHTALIRDYFQILDLIKKNTAATILTQHEKVITKARLDKVETGPATLHRQFYGADPDATALKAELAVIPDSFAENSDYHSDVSGSARKKVLVKHRPS